jgi:GxxExxY protein
MIENKMYPLSDLTGKIIGCAMEVHRQLGNGFQEVIYQRALAIEMHLQGLDYSREHEMQIFYKGTEIGTRRVDFFVEGQIMVELKAVVQLEDVHLAQAINYLEAYGLNIGLLINFGNISLQFKRVMKPQKSKIDGNQSPSNNQSKSKFRQWQWQKCAERILK